MLTNKFFYYRANQDMTLEQFKKIWWVEFLHRSMGRVTGLVYLVPFTYFWLFRELPRPLMHKLFGILGLLLCQVDKCVDCDSLVSNCLLFA